MNRLSGERVNAGRCEAMKASIAERIEQINAQSTILSGELESIAQARKDRQQAGQALAQEYERLSGARQQAKASFEEITRKKKLLQPRRKERRSSFRRRRRRLRCCVK